MSVLEIIKELQKQGHAVGYRKRSDGGYIITQIDGIKYTGATGNNTARNILGISMSASQMTQRRSNVERYIKIPRSKSGKKKGHKTKGNELTEEEKAKIKELQKLARESRKKTGIDRGTISRKTAIAYKKKHGKEALKELLDARIRYYQGYAYESNVELLIARLKRTILYFGNKKSIVSKLEECRTLLRININNIKEKYINEIYEKIYDLEKTKSEASVNEFLDYIKSIIG